MMTAHPAYSNGAYHAVLDMPLHLPRLTRKVGDALCKPRWRFGSLEVTSGCPEVTCQDCLRRAAAYGIEIRNQSAG